jgi:Zn-dependent protease
MEEGEFLAWLARFAPQGFGALAAPPTVLDHADPKQSHLDGLCLSRAWCFARLGDAAAAERLIAAALPHVAGGDYAGEHWLASFALLALTSEQSSFAT